MPKTQNQKLAASPKTRSQKRKPNPIPVPNTPAKKTKTPVKRGRKKKEPINETLNNDGSDEKIQKPATAPAKRGQKKKEKSSINRADGVDDEIQELGTVPIPVNQNKSEALNDEDRGDNENAKDCDDDNDESSISEYDDDGDNDVEDQEPATDLAKSSAKIPLTSISELLEISNNDMIEDNVVSGKRKPLTSITDNMNNNKFRNSLLNNSNEASDESFNNLINTPRYITPRSSTSHSTNTRQSTPITNARSSTLRNTRSPTPPSPRSTNSRLYTSHYDTSFNDDVFRSNTPLNDNTIFHPTSNTFNNNVFRSNNTSFRSSDLDSTPFYGMDNIHQICSWLCKNPNVLLLAYNMYSSMHAPVTNGFNFTSPNFNSTTVAAPHLQDDKVKASRDFLEELKCLFLRSRDPEKNAFDELVRRIFNCDLNTTEGTDWLRAASRNFGDFRNKFLDSIEEQIAILKEKRAEEGIPYTIRPSQREIISFVDGSITMSVLHRWLNATNMTELRARNTMPHLRRFVMNAMLVNYIERDTEKTKALDRLTRDIEVPSRNGRNFASNLQL